MFQSLGLIYKPVKSLGVTGVRYAFIEKSTRLRMNCRRSKIKTKKAVQAIFKSPGELLEGRPETERHYNEYKCPPR